MRGNGDNFMEMWWGWECYFISMSFFNAQLVSILIFTHSQM